MNVLTAQADSRGWRLDFPGGQRGGRGAPPRQVVWFYIPGLLADEDSVIPGWRVDRGTVGQIDLRNEDTGEAVLLILDLPP